MGEYELAGQTLKTIVMLIDLIAYCGCGNNQVHIYSL